MRDADPRANAFSELTAKINKMQVSSVPRIPVRDGEQRIGIVADVTVRTEVRIRYLVRRIKEYRELMETESDTDHRIRLAFTLDELMAERAYCVGLYYAHLQMEIDLRKWEGPPLFRLRTEPHEDGERIVAVILERDILLYRKRVARQSYDPEGALHYFLDHILSDEVL